MRKSSSHKKSIKKRIILSSLLNVLIPLIILGFFADAACYKISIKYVLQNLESSAETAAGRITWQLKAYQNIALETGGNARLTDDEASDADKQGTLNNIVAGYGLERGVLINADGVGTDGGNYSSQEFFKESMNGNAFVSDPITVSESSDKLAIAISAPLWHNGIYGGAPAGVVRFDPNEEFLNDITRELIISENGATYILNNKGTIIADPQTDVVKNQVNYIELAKSNNTYSGISALHKKMLAQEAGSATIKEDSKSMLVGYAPIPNTNGWSIAVSAPSTDFLMATYIAMVVTLVLIALAAISACAVSVRTGKSIGEPISACANRMRMLLDGDLSSPVETSKRQDEIGVLLQSMQMLQSGLNTLIRDIDVFLGRFASGDFTVKSTCPDAYVGDFSGILKAMRNMKSKLTDTICSIDNSSVKVAEGAGLLLNSSQALAQGTTEQASSVEELSSTAEDITSHITQTAEFAQTALDGTNRTYDEIQICNKHMNDLMNAMTVINGKSNEIINVIKAIEDIAFQTNILALNASVEAARAGAAGKGFAVVAGEVGNLAGKCGEAAKNTTVLIEETVQAVKNGTKLSTQTGESLDKVVENAKMVLEAVTNINSAAHEQAESVKQVTEGLEQISGVVQSSAASAEESAGASGELSQQAVLLKQLVDQFKLP